jgi:hypothetical protein
MGHSPSRVRRRADNEGWPFEAGEIVGGARLYTIRALPLDVQDALNEYLAAQNPVTDMTVQDFTVEQVAAILGISKSALRDRIRSEKWKGKNGDGVRVFPFRNLPEDVQAALTSLRRMTPREVRQRVLRLKRLVAELNKEIATIEGLIGSIHDKEAV